MKNRVRKVDVNKLEEDAFTDLSNQVSEKVRKIVDDAIERSNKILNIYGLQAKMQIAIEKKEADPKE